MSAAKCYCFSPEVFANPNWEGAFVICMYDKINDRGIDLSFERCKSLFADNRDLFLHLSVVLHSVEGTTNVFTDDQVCNTFITLWMMYNFNALSGSLDEKLEVFSVFFQATVILDYSYIEDINSHGVLYRFFKEHVVFRKQEDGTRKFEFIDHC